MTIKYTYQKSIGFNLNGKIKDQGKDQGILTQPNAKNNDNPLYTFLNDLISFKTDLYSFLFYQKDGRNKLQKGVTVRQKWVKEFCKKEYKLFRQDEKELRIKSSKDFKLSEDFVLEHINKWFDILNENIVNIQDFQAQNEHKKQRYSEVASYIKKIAQKSVLISILEFLNRVKSKNLSNVDTQALALKQKAKDIQTQIQVLLSEYLTQTAQGKRLFRATLSYYTLDKQISEEYFVKEEKKLKVELEAKCGWVNNPIFKEIDLKIKNLNVDDVNTEKYIKVDFGTKTLLETSQILKDWKANQKSGFSKRVNAMVDGTIDPDMKFDKVFAEELEKELEEEGLKDKKDNKEYKYNFIMFEPRDDSKDHTPYKSKEDKFDDFYLDSKELKNLSDQYGLTNDIEDKKAIKSMAKIRGEYFKNNCPNYKAYCEIYKKVQMKYGAINGKLKNLEAQKIESSFTTHWAVFIQQNDQLSIVFIPKIDRQEFRKILQQYTILPKILEDYTILRELKSLTVSALLKRLEGNETYFAELKTLENLQEAKKQIQIDRIKIQYCKNILMQMRMDLVDFTDFNLKSFLETEFDSWNHFKSKLEKSCYKFKEYYVPNGNIQTLIQNFDSLAINSYDLEPRPNQDRQNIEPHTKIWDKFIFQVTKNNDYKTRLNPEFTVYQRDIIDRQENNNLSEFSQKRHQEGKADRYTQSSFKVIFSLSQNSQNNPIRTESIDTLGQINEFNLEFNKTLSDWQTDGYYTFYGIDRGSDEMATLCKVRLNPDIKTESSKAKFPLYEPKFAPFEFYRLKKDIVVLNNFELIQILKNPSQWMAINQPMTDREENSTEGRIDIFNKYFKLITSSCLDMTRAKVIKNKATDKNIIIELGDVMTYEKFAMLNAKNKYGAITKLGKATHKLLFNEEKQVIYFQDTTGQNQELYFYKPQINTNKLEDILEELQTYIDNYSKVTFEESESLFRYKKALAGNMIGILNHLYTQEKGFIVLENLDERQLDRQTNNSTAIHRQLERSLYQKWQIYCTVPPKVNMPSMWQELFNEKDFDKKNKQIQLGNILLINEGNTSKSCPKCGLINKDYNIREYDKKIEEIKINNPDLIDQKWIQHRFGCVGANTGDCGFDTGSIKVIPNILPNLKGLDGLTSPDSVASYNIAKRGLELIAGNRLQPVQNSKNNNVKEFNTPTINHRNQNINPNHRRNSKCLI